VIAPETTQSIQLAHCASHGNDDVVSQLLASRVQSTVQPLISRLAAAKTSDTGTRERHMRDSAG
jgi:hypothetical protein